MRAGGGVLHGGQRGVDLERLGKVLGALDFEVVVGDAANKKGTKCRRLLTLCQIRQVWAGSVLERRQRRIDLERIGQLDDAFGSVGARCTAEGEARDTTQRVAGEAADEGRAKSVSGC